MSQRSESRLMSLVGFPLNSRQTLVLATMHGVVCFRNEATRQSRLTLRPQRMPSQTKNHSSLWPMASRLFCAVTMQCID